MTEYDLISIVRASADRAVDILNKDGGGKYHDAVAHLAIAVISRAIVEECAHRIKNGGGSNDAQHHMQSPGLSEQNKGQV